MITSDGWGWPNGCRVNAFAAETYVRNRRGSLAQQPQAQVARPRGVRAPVVFGLVVVAVVAITMLLAAVAIVMTTVADRPLTAHATRPASP